MQLPFELHSARVTGHPSDRSLKPLKAVEFDPNVLANRGPFNELNFTAPGRGIEDANAIAVGASTPNPHFSRKIQSVCAAWLLRTSIGAHARVGNRNRKRIEYDKVRNGSKSDESRYHLERVESER